MSPSPSKAKFGLHSRAKKRENGDEGRLKPPVAEGGPAVHGGGNRRDWFPGAGGRGATFIAAPLTAGPEKAIPDRTYFQTSPVTPRPGSSDNISLSLTVRAPRNGSFVMRRFPSRSA